MCILMVEYSIYYALCLETVLFVGFKAFAERDTRRLCVCCSLGNRYFLCFVMGFILLVSACTVLATWSGAEENKSMLR